MGTAREKKFWGLGLGKALHPPCPQRSQAVGQGCTDPAGLSSRARHPPGQALYLPCSSCRSLDMEPRPGASQSRDAEELDQG